MDKHSQRFLLFCATFLQNRGPTATLPRMKMPKRRNLADGDGSGRRKRRHLQVDTSSVPTSPEANRDCFWRISGCPISKASCLMLQQHWSTHRHALAGCFSMNRPVLVWSLSLKAAVRLLPKKKSTEVITYFLGPATPYLWLFSSEWSGWHFSVAQFLSSWCFSP